MIFIQRSIANFAIASAFAALASAVVLAGSNANAQAELKISAGSSVMDDIFLKIQVPFEKEAGIKLTFLDAKGTQNVFKNLIDGKVDAAVSAISYSAWLDLMKEYKFAVPGDISQRIIGRDTMNVITNKDVNLKKLSLEQVTAIFSGKVTNFKDVGAADKPIVRIIFGESKAKNANFRKLAMGDAAFGPIKEVSGEDDELAKAVATIPGAIGFRSSEKDVPGITVVETPVIGRPITMLNRGQPSEGLQKLITFIRNNGAKYGVK